MSTAASRTGLSWSARLLIALVLVIAGAAAATWALAHYQPAARFLGVVPQSAQPARPSLVVSRPPATAAQTNSAEAAARVQVLEARLAQLENATRHIEGSAGRSDALVIAFAARRAIERGLALGYLEPLLVDRFAGQHQRAVATVITASRQPILLDSLISEYQALGPELRRGDPGDGWWNNIRRELGTLIEVHPADRQPANPDARYARALRQLNAGDVDHAVAETMRMPGSSRAQAWVGKARRYIAVQRALDELESGALLSRPTQPS